MKRTSTTIKSFGGQVAFCCIFIIIGIAVIIGGSVMVNKQKSYTETTAIIDEIIVTGTGDDKSYTVLVDYVVDGREYDRIELNTYMSSYYEGKEISIKYDPENPGKIVSASAVIPAILFIGGFIFAIAGAVVLAGTIRHEKKRKSGALNGNNVEITEISEENKGYDLSNMKPVGKTADGKYSPFLTTIDDTAEPVEKTEIEKELEQTSNEKPYEGFSGTTEDNKYMKYAGVYKGDDDPYKTNDPNSIYNSEIGDDPYKK